MRCLNVKKHESKYNRMKNIRVEKSRNIPILSVQRFYLLTMKCLNIPRILYEYQVVRCPGFLQPLLVCTLRISIEIAMKISDDNVLVANSDGLATRFLSPFLFFKMATRRRRTKRSPCRKANWRRDCYGLCRRLCQKS